MAKRYDNTHSKLAIYGYNVQKTILEDKRATGNYATDDGRESDEDRFGNGFNTSGSSVRPGI